MKHKVNIAIDIATRAHDGQVDRDGEAYILHPLTVGLMGTTDEERMTGFLHDVLEDSSISAGELLAAGIPMSVVGALKLLTHDKSVPYYDYVQHIIDSHNPIALRVKYNDLKHNFARGRAYPDLQKKHGRALEMVTKALENRTKVCLYTHSTGNQVAVFAAGCFWGVQHYMSRQNGVLRTLVGYTGGSEDYPSYESVRTHTASSQHLEAVLVEYDADAISFEDLCKLFFEIHDPGQTDGQGPDKGAQYLSAVFYTSEEQRITTENLISLLRQKGYEVNTRVEKAGKFWIAEEYHQHYYDNTGGSPYCHFRQSKFCPPLKPFETL